MKEARKRFIEETQLFQRIAGVNITSEEDLGGDWDTMRSDKIRLRELKSIEEHRMIQDMAVRAAKARRS